MVDWGKIRPKVQVTLDKPLKKLVPTKTKVWIAFDKPGFHEGEDVVGRVNAESSDWIHLDEVRVEARVYEHYKEFDDVILRNRLRKRRDRKTTRFSSNVRISGPTDFGPGFRGFPFAISIPPYSPTHEEGSIEYNIKAVVAIKGRPDATSETNVSFLPRVPSALTVPGFASRIAYDGPPQVIQSTQVVTREIIKKHCKFCDSLNDLSPNRCPNCGAPQ